MTDLRALTDDERRQRGFDVMRTLYGTQDPEAAFDSLSERFPGGLADLITDFCFGDVWTRPALDRRTRSLLVLGIIAALGLPSPLRTHVKGALNHGATKEEVREVFVQVAAYAGVPAAVTAAEVAEEVFKELEQ